MFFILLAVIYIAFISLGLPDSLIGVSWPIISLDFGVQISFLGFITMIISVCTVISSLLSSYFNKKLGSFLVSVLSILLTAIALIGFSLAKEFWVLLLFAVPYGLGAGSIDATLNNYVATHFSPRHMNWLHSFWGIGTIISPYIISYCISTSKGWEYGFKAIAMIQIVIFIIISSSYSLWKENKNRNEIENIDNVKINENNIKNKKILFCLLSIFFYCAFENTIIQWGTTFMVNVWKFEKSDAAFYGSLFFIGVTLGRLISGFIAIRMSSKLLIRSGVIITFLGLLVISLPLFWRTLSLLGFIIMGVGCAPIFPSLLQLTPSIFGKENSQKVMGILIASQYIGSGLIPPLFGMMTELLSFSLFNIFLFVLLTMFIINYCLLENKKCVN